MHILINLKPTITIMNQPLKVKRTDTLVVADKWKYNSSGKLKQLPRIKTRELYKVCERLTPNSGKEAHQSIANIPTRTEYKAIIDAQNISGEYLEVEPDDSPSGIYGKEKRDLFI